MNYKTQIVASLKIPCLYPDCKDTATGFKNLKPYCQKHYELLIRQEKLKNKLLIQKQKNPDSLLDNVLTYKVRKRLEKAKQIKQLMQKERRRVYHKEYAQMRRSKIKQ